MEQLLMNIFIFLFFLFYRTKIKARRALVKFMRCFSFVLEDKHSLHNMIFTLCIHFLHSGGIHSKDWTCFCSPLIHWWTKEGGMGLWINWNFATCKNFMRALSLFLNYKSNSFTGFATALYLWLYWCSNFSHFSNWFALFILLPLYDIFCFLSECILSKKKSLKWLEFLEIFLDDILGVTNLLAGVLLVFYLSY